MAATLVVASGVALAVNKIGTNDPDTLKGTNGADNLLGRGGNDDLLGLGGRDKRSKTPASAFSRRQVQGTVGTEVQICKRSQGLRMTERISSIAASGRCLLCRSRSPV